MSHETTIQPSRNGQQAADVIKTPDPEVVPKAKRRRFSAEYKLRILEEADVCTRARRGRRPVAPGRAVLVPPGRLAAATRERRVAGLGPTEAWTQAGPAGGEEMARLRRENERLQRAWSKPRRSSRSKKNSRSCLVCRRARATSSHDPNSRRTGGRAAVSPPPVRCWGFHAAACTGRGRHTGVRAGARRPAPRPRALSATEKARSVKCSTANASGTWRRGRSMPRCWTRASLPVLHQHDVPHPGRARRGARAPATNCDIRPTASRNCWPRRPTRSGAGTSPSCEAPASGSTSTCTSSSTSSAATWSAG